jgi:tetrathionate reductase subunit B
VEACPYDARFIHPLTRKADKCDFCLPRLERGEAPVCVATCTGNAKYFGDLEDHKSDVFRLVYAEGARRLESKDAAVGPNVYYLGKPAQLALLAESFPPRAPRLPLAGEVWRRVVQPLALLAVGATFLGQAAAFFVQLAKGEKDFDD